MPTSGQVSPLELSVTDNLSVCTPKEAPDQNAGTSRAVELSNVVCDGN